MFVPDAEQLERWGLPAGPLAEPVLLVRPSATGRWHAADCTHVRRVSALPPAQPVPLVGTPVCGVCQPPASQAARDYVAALARLAEVDRLEARLADRNRPGRLWGDPATARAEHHWGVL